jgi:glycerol-3-phosphate cytidylyltransferase
MSAGRPEGTLTVGYVPGVFDMFHVGHLNILRASRERCDRLIAGVVTDEVVEAMKGYRPIVPLDERMAIVGALRFVDEVVVDTSADKREVWRDHRFDVLFKGDDWQHTERGERLEQQMAEIGARVVYLPYTPHTSSTMLRQTLDRLLRSLGS